MVGIGEGQFGHYLPVGRRIRAGCRHGGTGLTAFSGVDNFSVPRRCKLGAPWGVPDGRQRVRIPQGRESGAYTTAPESLSAITRPILNRNVDRIVSLIFRLMPQPTTPLSLLASSALASSIRSDGLAPCGLHAG